MYQNNHTPEILEWLLYICPSIESVAMARFTPEQVAEFLQSIGLGQYAKSFIENDVNGEMMLEADDDSALEEIGVESRLHRIKIMVLFKRQVFGSTGTRLE